MKDNKITRKIYRLEELESLIKSLLNQISYYESDIERRKEALKEHQDDTYIESSLDELTQRIEEAKKLLAELEKLA